jgi:hypothetical protein
MRRVSNSVKDRPMLLLGLIIGILLTAVAPASAMPETTDSEINCENGTNDFIVLAKNQGKRPPGACPTNLDVSQGSAPPPGAIQINPTAPLPDDAVCEAPSNNACSQQGFACLPGKTCKDTWNASTHQCMCQCRK